MMSVLCPIASDRRDPRPALQQGLGGTGQGGQSPSLVTSSPQGAYRPVLPTQPGRGRGANLLELWDTEPTVPQSLHVFVQVKGTLGHRTGTRGTEIRNYELPQKGSHTRGRP